MSLLASCSTAVPRCYLPTNLRLRGSRKFGCTVAQAQAAVPTVAPAKGAHSHLWVVETKQRVAKCLTFGLSEKQAGTAAALMRIMATEWKTLLPAAMGFLPTHRGLQNHEVAWGEMDSFGHVNNVNYNRYAESSRVNWVLDFARKEPRHANAWGDLMTTKSIGLIMGEIKTVFMAPVVYPDVLSAYHRVDVVPQPRIRPRHEDPLVGKMRLECIIVSHRQMRHVAYTREVVAAFDYRVGRKAAYPAFVVDALEEMRLQQLAEEARAKDRIHEIMAAVEALERDTWDRDGATEDMGSAALQPTSGV